MELPFEIYGCLATSGWITSTWRDMQQFGITIADSTPHIPLRTTKDQRIITAFVHAGYKSNELILLNRMRIYLRVATVADLVQADGKEVKPEVWHGIKPMTCRSNIDWPKQGQIPKSHWNIWQTALKTSFGMSLNQSRCAKINLGEWIDADEFWQWFFHPNLSGAAKT